jgi:hypothetical protein
MSPEEVAEVMDLSVSHSYVIIRKLNAELAAKGYLTRTGRIPRKYFYERTGLDPELSAAQQ